MAIHSSPFPSDGVHLCATINDASRIVKAAVALQGIEILGDLKEFYDEELGIRTGVGVVKVRPMIEELWHRMSPDATKAFLLKQWQAGVDYMNELVGTLAAGFGPEVVDFARDRVNDLPTYQMLMNRDK